MLTHSKFSWYQTATTTSSHEDLVCFCTCKWVCGESSVNLGHQGCPVMITWLQCLNQGFLSWLLSWNVYLGKPHVVISCSDLQPCWGILHDSIIMQPDTLFMQNLSTSEKCHFSGSTTRIKVQMLMNRIELFLCVQFLICFTHLYEETSLSALIIVF